VCSRRSTPRVGSCEARPVQKDRPCDLSIAYRLQSVRIYQRLSTSAGVASVVLRVCSRAAPGSWVRPSGREEDAKLHGDPEPWEEHTRALEPAPIVVQMYISMYT
jgi:hypothetical protein